MTNASRRTNRVTASALVAVVAAMGGLAWASVPLYQWFCQVTGYGGTTQAAVEMPAEILDREMTVRFNADTARGLPWAFKPVQRQITLRVGDTGLAFYRAVNHSDRPVTGTATFNVTPAKAGIYFDKIDCFCFTEQTLEAGQEAELAVSFFIDPDISADPNLDEVRTITLSYTFFEKDGAETALNSSHDGAAAPAPPG